MPTTPGHALRYPQTSDSADVPRDIANLANDVELWLPPQTATTPPSSPVDGQRWTLVAGTTVWEFVYRSAAPDSYKWHFLGGSPAYHEVANDEAITTSQTVFSTAATAVQVALPRAGFYDVLFGCVAYAVGAQSILVSPGGPIAPNDTDSAQANTPAAAQTVQLTRLIRREYPVATLYLFYRSGQAANFDVLRRWMQVTPVRVS